MSPHPSAVRPSAVRPTRRALIVALGATVAAPAFPIPSSSAAARERYEVVGVEMRPSAIVAARVVTDLPGRIAARIRGHRGGGTPVRVIVELRTIDPYRGGRPNERRGIAARYAIVDAATDRTLRADRFTERTTIRDDAEGTFAIPRVPRSQGEGERELADEVAGHVLRHGL